MVGRARVPARGVYPTSNEHGRLLDRSSGVARPPAAGGTGDDFWRYRWEGTIQLHRVNPYLHAPDDPALAPLRDADWLRVNHRDYPAIYPPAAELIFAVLAALHAPPLGDKLLFTLADLGVVVMLSRLLARGSPPSAGPPRAAAWYAWNPLAVYAFAGGGHYDSLMLLALVAAVWTLDRACAAGSARLAADAQAFDGRHDCLCPGCRR